jgi:hypothetical protein
VNKAMNLRVSQNVENFLSSLKHFSFSGRTLLHGVRYVTNYAKLLVTRRSTQCADILNMSSELGA